MNAHQPVELLHLSAYKLKLIEHYGFILCFDFAVSVRRWQGEESMYMGNKQATDSYRISHSRARSPIFRIRK